MNAEPPPVAPPGSPPTPDLQDVVAMLEEIRRLSLADFRNVALERAYPSGTYRGEVSESGGVDVRILHERPERDWDRRSWLSVYAAADAAWPVPRDRCGCGDPF